MILRIQRRHQCLIIVLWWILLLSCFVVIIIHGHGHSSQPETPQHHHRFIVDKKHRDFLRQSVTHSSTTFGLLRSIPILQHRHRERRRRSRSQLQDDDDDDDDRQDKNNKNRNSNNRRQKRVIPVAAAVVQERKEERNTKKKEKRRYVRLPTIDTSGLSSSTGFFYGLDAKTVEKATTHRTSKRKTSKSKPLAMKEALGLTLDELRTMRQEMEALRKEMEVLKRQLAGQEEEEAEVEVPPSAPARMARSKRQREFDKIGRDVEKWAEKLLFKSDFDSGWTEVQCNKMLQSALNKDGRTRAHVQWMRDSRGEHADPNDNREYPCLKMTSTIDAPLDVVCAYLSQKDRLEEYNCLVVDQKDVEEIAPHAKICWSQTPSLLFVKPRDFLTYCHHKWLRDGTQVVVNQALDDHADKEKLVQGRAMAYALRGANYMSRDPDDPENKTRISILAHGKPGVGVPDWACRTAIKSLIPIEPFKFFQKLNESVKRARPIIEEEMERTRQTKGVEMVSATTGRSRQPAGLAQLGYACFWPNGGGLVAKKGSVVSSSSAMSTGGDDISSNSSIEATPPQLLTTSDSDDSSSSGKVIADEDSTLTDVPQSQSQEGYSNDDTANDEESSSSPSVVIESTTLGDENDSKEDTMDAKDNSAGNPSNDEGHNEAVPVGGDGDDSDESKEDDINDSQG